MSDATHHDPLDPEPLAALSERDDTIRVVRSELRRRSGKTWSVRGGRGTAWGWITISAPPARCDRFGAMSEADRAQLAELLGLEHVHDQGVQVPDSRAQRTEYVARARGHNTAVR